MRSYLIPKEISSELKISRWLYLIDLMVLVILLCLYSFLSNFVHESLSWWFKLFMMLVGIFLIVRPASNPQKRMYQAVYLALIRSKETYYSISHEEEDDGAIQGKE